MAWLETSGHGEQVSAEARPAAVLAQKQRVIITSRRASPVAIPVGDSGPVDSSKAMDAQRHLTARGARWKRGGRRHERKIGVSASHGPHQHQMVVLLPPSSLALRRLQ